VEEQPKLVVVAVTRGGKGWVPVLSAGGKGWVPVLSAGGKGWVPVLSAGATAPRDGSTAVGFVCAMRAPRSFGVLPPPFVAETVVAPPIELEPSITSSADKAVAVGPYRSFMVIVIPLHTHWLICATAIPASQRCFREG
jgi:hypothetical protein